MEPLLIHPGPAPPELQRAIELGGWSWAAVNDEAEARGESWSGAIITLDPEDPAPQLAFARSVRTGDLAIGPVLFLVRGHQLAELDAAHNCFDDFCVSPFHPIEFELRLRHLLVRSGGAEPAGADLIAYGPLVLNAETYQAKSDGRPLDLTYMEYELLKFLVSSPGRVFTRETLLSQVWGYEYYGGARTVDVHVRRLRSKLGEEHAALIQTVRSVGYRFGESRWSA